MLIMGQVVKGVYAVAIAAVLIAALWPRQSGVSPAAVSAPAAPSPAPAAAPVSEFYDPMLGAMVQQIRAWDMPTVTRWTLFCAETQDGAGYGYQAELVCRSLRYRN